TMADMNIPANDAPTEQAPAIAPLTRDGQILPSSKWVPIGKSNCVLNVQNCQLDEQWFNLHKDILRDALDITPTNDDIPFVAPPSSDTVIEYVNTLGYPNTLRNMSAIYDRRETSLPLDSLGYPFHRFNIDYAKRICEEFVQSIQTFLTKRKNLTTASRGKKKTAHLLILNSSIYNGYLEHVAEYQRYLDEEHNKADDITPKPTSSQPSKPIPTPTEPSQKDQGKKRKLVKETSDVQSPAKRSKACKVTKKRIPKSPLKLINEPSNEGEQGEQTQRPARLVVLREPDSRRIQQLPDVQGKGKKKRRTPMPTKASGHAKSPSLDAKLALTDSETESNNEVPKINTGDQDKGQAGPNPGNQDEGHARPNPGDQDEDQAGSNPSDAAESQPQSSHVVPVRPNLEHMDLEATDASTQQKPEQKDEEFTTTAYPNVQENLKLPIEDQVILEEPASSSRTLSSLQNLEKDLSFTDQFFVEKPQEEEPGKTNAEAEVQSMVLVPIHQDTSLVPPTTTSVIDLTKSQSDSPLPTSTATISTIMTTTTTLPPPPPQPQQSTADLILVKRIVDEIKSLELKYSNQRLADQEEARKKRRQRRDVPRTPSGFPPSQPPPPAGASGTPGGVFGTHELSLTDYLMQDDSIPEEQVLLSNDEDSENDHQPKVGLRKDEKTGGNHYKKTTTPEPAWIIPSPNVSDTGDITTFMKWYCQKMNKTELTQADFEGQAYEVVKAFCPDVIYLQFQIEECHKMLTNQGSSPALLISKMKATSAKYGISHWWFNRQKFYIDRHDSPSRQKEVRTHIRILSVVRIKVYSRYGYDYLSKIILRRADFQEHTIAEKDFKNLYPSDFEDLNLLLLQGHLNHLPGSDKRMLSTAVKL
ncbi:hypothetical protein Tco_1012674, partial [Tanacetum coccineum]